MERRHSTTQEQGRDNLPQRHLPDDQGCSAKGIVQGSLAADSRTGTTTGLRIVLEGSSASSPREECVHMTGKYLKSAALGWFARLNA